MTVCSKQSATCCKTACESGQPRWVRNWLRAENADGADVLRCSWDKGIQVKQRNGVQHRQKPVV